MLNKPLHSQYNEFMTLGLTKIINFISSFCCSFRHILFAILYRVLFKNLPAQIAAVFVDDCPLPEFLPMILESYCSFLETWTRKLVAYFDCLFGCLEHQGVTNALFGLLWLSCFYGHWVKFLLHILNFLLEEFHFLVWVLFRLFLFIKMLKLILNFLYRFDFFNFIKVRLNFFFQVLIQNQINNLVEKWIDVSSGFSRGSSKVEAELFSILLCQQTGF